MTTTIPQQSHLMASSDIAFKRDLASIIPELRAFGRSLCGSAELADDLVQETMLKAWAARTTFQPDTKFRAWIFTILRNIYFSQVRRRRFVGDWDDAIADHLSVPPEQNDVIELRDIMRALQELPLTQREALILIGAGGIAYEEAAEIAGVPVGTIKSRVSRARVALQALIADGQLAQPRHDFANDGDVIVDLMEYIERLREGRAAPSEIVGEQAAA